MKKGDIRKAERIYKKSIFILKKSQLKNGGCLASFARERYPYIYPRDHGFCILAFISADILKNARSALEFILRRQSKNGCFPQRFDPGGKDASYKPVQIDGTGLVLYAFCKYIKKTNDIGFARKYWKEIKKAVSYIKKSIFEDCYLIYTPNSLHEFPPYEKGLEIWANAVCCSALVEIADVADIINVQIHTRKLAEKVKEGIYNFLWNSRVDSYIKTIRLFESSSVETNVDVSCCGLVEFSIFPDHDIRMIKTVKRIERLLWNKELGGICRYSKYEGRNNGGWGPWPHYTLLIAKHYIRLKNKKKADKYLKWVLDIAYGDLLPEHVATKKEFEEYVVDFGEASLLREDRVKMINNARKHPLFKKGVAYVSIPLVWPHAEFIRTWNLYKEAFK